MYVFIFPPAPWVRNPSTGTGRGVKGPEMLHTKATGSGPQPQTRMTGSRGKCEGATLSGGVGGCHVWISNLYLVHTLVSCLNGRHPYVTCGNAGVRRASDTHPATTTTHQAQSGQAGRSTTSTSCQPPFSLVSLPLLAPAGRAAVPRMVS